MRERPILFRVDMVRAILEGRKNMTRRVVKPQPTGESRPLSEWSKGLAAACHDHSPDPDKLAKHSDRLKGRIFPFTTSSGGLMSPTCPYGIPGDWLWVKETFEPLTKGYSYRADGLVEKPFKQWKSSRFMPRIASRILLEITNVRVERLQDITEDGAKLEGAKPSFLDGNDIVSVVPFYRDGFMHLWNEINGPGSWDENPYVWVVSFKRINK